MVAKKRVLITLPDELYAELEGASKKNMRTKSEYISYLLKKELEGI